MIYQISKSSNKYPLNQIYLISINELLYILSMNFITDLSLSNDKNIFLIFTDKFIKIIQFISYNKIINIEDIIHLYFYYYYNIFDLLIKFILNYDIYFILWFWRILMRLFNIQKEIIFIFYSNINNQTEKINQIIEIDLRYFLRDEINKYSNWIKYISILKYEYNSMKYESIDYTSNKLYYITSSHDISNLMISSYLNSKFIKSLIK